MVFNSLNFLMFFTVVFFAYYFLLNKKTQLQNWLLLVVCYLFYGIVDVRMIPLLLAATTIFYFLGIAISTSNKKESSLLNVLGVVLGIGLLLYFKYFNFFLQSFSVLFNSIGLRSNWGTFKIILPLGVSFFTFRLISYTVEVYRGKIQSTRDFVVFATYIAFFPTIISGPIDRPNSFIPQIENKRSFDYFRAIDGSRQFLWGMFKKMVIADNLAGFVNTVWADISNQSGVTLIITAILYSFEMYADFSGYSDMAIGIGKLLGFRITRNFNYPFFSRNIAEYWRNWHMSLTSWLTDYIFMPLNVKFRNFGNLGLIMALIINMVVIGLWHGANWTFVIFGLYHGLLFVPLILSGSFFKKKKLKTNSLGLPAISDLLRMVATFLLVTLGLIMFRADNIGQFWIYIKALFNKSNYLANTAGIGSIIPTIGFTIGMLFFEWIFREMEYPLQITDKLKIKLYRISIYWILIIIIILNSGDEQKFIYFQF